MVNPLAYEYYLRGVDLYSKARQLDPGVKLNSSTLNAYLYLAQYDNFLSSLPGTDGAALIVFYRGFAEYHKKDYARAALDFDRAFALDRSLLQAQVGKAISFAIHNQDSDAEFLLRSVETKIDERLF